MCFFKDVYEQSHHEKIILNISCSELSSADSETTGMWKLGLEVYSGKFYFASNKYYG